MKNINDNMLDKMLYDYYKRKAPEVFRVKELKKPCKELNFMKNKLVLRAVSIAACVAIVCTLGVFSHHGGQENSFSVIANAETASPDELKENTFTAMEKIMWNDFGIGDERFALAIAFNMRVKGDNIDTVTYKINNGLFEIHYGCDDAVDKKRAHIDYDDYVQPGYGAFSEYTVKYDSQPMFSNEDYPKSRYINGMTPIGIPLVVKASDGGEGAEILKKAGALYKNNTKNVSAKLNEYLERLLKICLKDITVDVTARFKDGSKQTKTLKIEVKDKKKFLFSDAVFTAKLVKN